LAPKAIKLNYLSDERFFKDYTRLCTGKIFFPTNTPLPLKTRLSLNLSIPDIEQVLSIEGQVIKTIDDQTAAQRKKTVGMLVSLIGGPEVALKELRSALYANTYYRMLLNLPEPVEKTKPGAAEPDVAQDANQVTEKLAADEKPSVVTASTSEANLDSDAEPLELTELYSPAPSVLTQEPGTSEESLDVSAGPQKVSDPMPNDALTMDWIREAIAQEEATREKESIAQLAAAPVTEKKQLSQMDRKKAKPSGEFLMELTKAMLLSGNYATNHPGTEEARQGLYKAFKRCLEDSSEIMITNHQTRERINILITGILDEPVNVRTLVGSNMAQLFVTSLQSYFKRKNLVSLGIKKNITPQHFDRFVDIMSDPMADTADKHEIGKVLSRTLAEHGITEISTVFVDDLIVLELDLPPQVEMAIQRLAKDLKVIPLFRTASEEDLHKMKRQIIPDILRPLNHPEFLKDLIINCCLIGQHTQDLETEDIEEVIIDGFALKSLLPTARLIFEELDRLREMKADNPDDAILENRFGGVKRILQRVARRLMLEDVGGAQSFLEELYLNQVLSFEEIPPDVQYLVNTEKMVRDAQNHIPTTVNRILNVKTSEDAAILIKFAHRILPALIDKADWQTISYLAEAVDKAAKTRDLFKNMPGRPANPLLAVFKDRTDEMVIGYENADEPQRDTIDNITGLLGTQGIEILSKVLSDSEDRGARKNAMTALTQKGKLVKDWIFKVLDDPKQKWFLKRNALMLLEQVGKNEEDIEHARQLLHHEHPRVRDEALNVVISLKAADAEDVVIAALGDADDKVRWRAINGLADLSPVSEASIKKLLGLITVEPPEDKEDAVNFYRKTAQLIRALGGLSDIPNREDAEDTILEIARQSSEQKKGLLNRIKKTSDPDQSTVLAAAITTLGNIGSAKSEAFIEELAASKSPQAEPAQKAAENIKLRNMEQLSADALQSNVKENHKSRR
jgi:HEAT repeat protein